jgi:hexokinase
MSQLEHNIIPGDGHGAGFDQSRREADYFESIGLKPLSVEEESLVFSTYQRELLAGLSSQPSSVKMYLSHLEPVRNETLKEGSEALVVEIGGTNMYGAIVRVKDGMPVVVNAQKDPLVTRRFESADHFYQTLIGGLKPIIEAANPDAIGIVYSFPGAASRVPNGVDVRSPKDLPKEFVIPGIDELPVGEAFLLALSKTKQVRNIPIAVLNDTVAVQLAADSSMGGVVGTGFNLAFSTPVGIVNSESGGFALGPTHHVAQAVDARSGNVGLQLAEKQIAGLYLAEQMKILAKAFAERGIEIPFPVEAIDGERISDILSWGNPHPLKEAATRLTDRSAQILGVLIATVTGTFPEQFKDHTLQIPIEGSLFWNVPGYMDKTREVAQRLTGKQIGFLNIENAGRIGAAVAALSFVKQ